ERRRRGASFGPSHEKLFQNFSPLEREGQGRGERGAGYGPYSQKVPTLEFGQRLLLVGVVHGAGASNTSRTLRSNTSGANGFWSRASSASWRPCRTTVSSV